MTARKPFNSILPLTDLEKLLASVLENDPKAPAYNEDRFAQWLVREARDQMTPAERRENERAAQRFTTRARLRLITNAATRSLPVQPLLVRDARTVSTVAGAIAAAARDGCAPWIEESQVAAGTGRELWDESCDRWVELPDGTRGAKHVAVSVHGESMTPVLLPHDVIVVRIGTEAAVGQIVVARLPDGGHVVKRVASVTRLTVELESFNAEFTPFHIPRDSSLIVGAVTHLLRHGVL